MCSSTANALQEAGGKDRNVKTLMIFNQNDNLTT